MSYSGADQSNPLNGNGAFVVGGVGGAIVSGPRGVMTQTYILGNHADAIFGDTSGPNAVNPSGTPSGARLPQQNGFRTTRR
jgi:hypothetical protein